DPAMVVVRATRKNRGLVPVRRLFQGDPFNGCIRWIQNPDSQHILCALFDCSGNVERKGGFPSFVVTDGNPVYPNLRLVIDCPEAQQIPTLSMWVCWRVKEIPIPRNPMIIRENILNNPGDLRPFR